VQVAFTTIPSLIEYIRAGKLRALAVASATRSDTLPGVPTVGEFLPGYEASGMVLARPRARPLRSLKSSTARPAPRSPIPKTKSRLVGLGVEPMSMTPAEFGKFMMDETEKWGKVIRAANIKAE
jgi:tripartite-type tricarboxylate transporter receptor subunit TctC